MIYFVIFAVLSVLTIGIYLAKHGQQKTAKYSVWWKIADFALAYWLMYMWGAFDTLFGVSP